MFDKIAVMNYLLEFLSTNLNEEKNMLLGKVITEIKNNKSIKEGYDTQNIKKI